MACDISNETEKRIMYGTVVATWIGILFMLVSVCTDFWMIVIIPGGLSRDMEPIGYNLGHHSGLWRICMDMMRNDTGRRVYFDHCHTIAFYKTKAQTEANPEIDTTILDFNRAETAFAILSLVLMALGQAFSIYSVLQPRYMFKRLTAIIHLMTAVCILVCAEVLANSAQYERDHLPARLPSNSLVTFGYSFGLAWVSFVFFVVSAIVFAFFSKKRKGHKARSENEAMENEPVHLGRP